ncbi:MAG: carboxypeptidase-like regulatory domain-containing protein [bacterium]|nr:carboxypeptidase-like regulatory domain-containing protein [bacterium]
MIKKIITFSLIALISILLILITGCFQVNRNNIFDPDSDEYDPNAVKVTVKGKIFRGWSNITMENVRVEIGDQVDYSDEDGYYEVTLSPGTYTLRASKTGWRTETYNITVEVKKKEEYSQREDISMFIWYEYWDYSVPSTPPSPWDYNVQHSTSGWSQARIWDDASSNHFLQLSVDDYSDGMAYASTWLNQVPTPSADPVYVISVAVVFFPGRQMFTDIGFSLHDYNNATQFFGVYWGKTSEGKLYYFSDGLAGDVEIFSTFTYVDQLLYFEFYLHPQNTQFMDMFIYTENGSLIFSEMNIYVGTNVSTMDGIDFEIHPRDWMWATPQGGVFAVYSVEFF